MQNMNPLKVFANGIATRNQESKVFDWQKAANLIKEALKANPKLYVEAGLEEDWSCTADVIMQNGEVVHGMPYLASTWATPIVVIGEVEHECYKMAHEVPDWNYDTVWPEVALDILKA